MSTKKENVYPVLFTLTAVFSVLAPISLLLALQDYLLEEFSPTNFDDDSIYWMIGTVIVLGIFGLLCAYMIYNKVKHNITPRSKIMAILLLPLLIGGTSFAFFYYSTTFVAEDRGPYLSWMADPSTTMTISFEQKIPKDYDVQYGSSPDNLALESTFTRLEKRPEDGYYHYIVNLTRLSPDSRYYYKIPGFMDSPAAFKTAPATQAKFKFLLYGDSREDNRVIDNQHYPLIEQLVNQMDVSELSFAINTGDTARVHDNPKPWNFHFDAIKELSKSVPYFVASGNHEWNTRDNWDFTQQPALDIQDYPIGDDPTSDVYTLDEVSFSFGYGNAFFIFIGYPHAGSDNEEYETWLENQLAIGKTSYEFTFVSLHRPPFDDREGEDDDDNPDIIKNECPLFHEYGVDAVFAGHNHILAHQSITWDSDPTQKNITYLIAGGGGAPQRNPQYGTWDNDYGMGFSGKTIYCKRAFHYYIVEIDGAARTASFTAYELGGEILETFTLSAN